MAWGGWGGQTAEVRVHVKSQARCHISQPCVSICLTIKGAATVRNVQERATVRQHSATLPQLQHVARRDVRARRFQMSDQKSEPHQSNI